MIDTIVQYEDYEESSVNTCKWKSIMIADDLSDQLFFDRTPHARIPLYCGPCVVRGWFFGYVLLYLDRVDGSKNVVFTLAKW